jgi:MoaD family protein
MIAIPVRLWSYFRDLTGKTELLVEIAEGATLQQFLEKVYEEYPRLAGLRQSTLVAVGVEYTARDYVLKPGDVVSLFPPVQGG